MKPKLLVAEDHLAMRAKVVSLLKSGFDVVALVGDGSSAVEAANKLMPDVLVLDVSMPILNGPDVARRLKGPGLQGEDSLPQCGHGCRSNQQLLHSRRRRVCIKNADGYRPLPRNYRSACWKDIRFSLGWLSRFGQKSACFATNSPTDCIPN